MTGAFPLPPCLRLAARGVLAVLLAGVGAGPSTLVAQSAPGGRAAAERALLAGRYDEVHTLVAALADDPAAAVLRARAYVAVGRLRARPRRCCSRRSLENPIGDAAVELGILQPACQGRRARRCARCR